MASLFDDGPLASRRLTREDVMTGREVVELLGMPSSTVYELARRGEIPAAKLGRTWRFLRPAIEQMLVGRDVTSPPPPQRGPASRL